MQEGIDEFMLKRKKYVCKSVLHQDLQLTVNKTEHAVQSYVARKEAIETKNITAIDVIINVISTHTYNKSKTKKNPFFF